MSSSTASNAASTGLGQCIVCGKDSTTACSVCRKAGLDWMYFCSREHQKLIWKVHKRVCGQNPFKYPALSEEEAQELWEMRDWQNIGGETWSDRLVLKTNVVVRDGIHTDTRLGAGTTAERDRSLELLLFTAKAQIHSRSELDGFNEYLRITRARAFDAKVWHLPRTSDSTVPFESSRNLVAEDPFGFMAWLSARHAPSQFKVEYASSGQGLVSQAWSSFHHRLLILIARLAITFTSSSVARNLNSAVARSELDYLVNSCNLVPSSNQLDGEVFRKLTDELAVFVGFDIAVRA